MKRIFAIILLLTAGALLVSPEVSHASSYDHLTLTDYDGYDVVYNDYIIYDEFGNATVNPTPTSEAAYIYYKTVEEDGLNVTSYQVLNVGFDPVPGTNPAFPPISQLLIPMVDNEGNPLIDGSAYTFGTPDIPGYITVTDFSPYGVIFGFDGGLPVGGYSGIFTVSTGLFIHEGDTVLAQLWDGGESTNANLTFALHVAKEDPGTPMPDPLTVSIDIKPGSCPNPLEVKKKGDLPAAVLGSVDFDVTQVDIASIRLEGVPPHKSSFEDVATPFEPYTGKEDCFEDCTTEGEDGFVDLTLKFDSQEVLAALGQVDNKDCLVLTLTGNLQDGTPIVGEDVIIIRK